MRYNDVFLSALSVGAAFLLSASPLWAQDSPGSKDTPSGSSGSSSYGSGSQTDMQRQSPQRDTQSQGSQWEPQKQTQSQGSTEGTAQGSAMDQGERRGSRMAGGMAKEDVKKAQEALKEKGHDPGPVDGIIGPRTQAALRAFQQAQGISATGQLDDQTKKALGLDKGNAGGTSSMGGKTSRGSSARPGESEKGGQQTQEQTSEGK